MTATHAKEEESQENRISIKEFQSNGIIAMEKQKINPQPQMMMMMMMMMNSNNNNNTTSTAQSNFDRCFSNQLKKFTEIESGSSTEEEEYSPKSVKEFGLKRFVHHQVLKIKEEDSHIGKDYIKEITMNRFALIHHHHHHHLTSQQQVRALILPCSPLSGKSSIKSLL